MSEPSQTSLTRRLFRTLLRTAVTLVFVLAAGGMVVAGRGLLAERVAEAPAPDPASLPSVSTRAIELVDGYQVERLFTGQVQSSQRTDVSFEVTGTIAEIFVDEGDRVAAGAPLVRLDTRLILSDITRLTASRTALEAQAELARRTSTRQSALQDRGFASQQALDTASLGLAELTARIAETDAALLGMQIRLEKATIHAPYDGQVPVPSADIGSSANPGQPILTVIEDGVPQFRVGLSPDLVEQLGEGAAVELQIGNRRYKARLASVLPVLDAVTRTRTALFDILSKDPPTLRETGRLILVQAVAEPGAWVPVAALEAGPRGLWRILTVSQSDGQEVVATETVEVLFADAERAYVRGTFRDGDRFVVDGAHRVVPGQIVQMMEAGL